MEFGPSASSALVLVLVLVLGWYVVPSSIAIKSEEV